MSSMGDGSKGAPRDARPAAPSHSPGPPRGDGGDGAPSAGGRVEADLGGQGLREGRARDNLGQQPPRPQARLQPQVRP